MPDIIDPLLRDDEIDDSYLDDIRRSLTKKRPSTRRRVFEKFFLAALGSIPWVGGFISAVASLKLDQAGIEQDDLQSQWLAGHRKKLAQLRGDLDGIADRFEELGEEIDERITSEEYLTLVGRAFSAWDRADTDEKRRYAANLISNAAGTRVCSDDVVRLFIDWLDSYHEAHFAVIRRIYDQPGSTRYDIWTAVYGEVPREDSAEADLFKMLIRDLSIGGVIRQQREVNLAGKFVKKRPTHRNSGGSVLESAFEETKPYVLTDLGQQFVHYTMSEVVTRLEAEAGR